MKSSISRFQSVCELTPLVRKHEYMVLWINNFEKMNLTNLDGFDFTFTIVCINTKKTTTML